MVTIEKEDITLVYVLTPNILEKILTPGIDYVWVSPVTYADIRKWGRDTYTTESDPASLKTGLMGTFHGTKIYQSKCVPDDYLIGVSNLKNQVGGGLVFHKWLDENEPSRKIDKDEPKIAPERVTVEITDQQFDSLFGK